MLPRRSAICFLLISSAAWGQTQPSEAAGSNLQARALGPDDLISLSVYGAPELTRSFRIGGDGRLGLPMLQRPIEAKGLLPNQLESAVASALKDDHLLISPIVSITVTEYASRPITVIGAVRRPLTFQASGTVTLLDALARAEGLSPEAGPEILLTQEPERIARISVHKLIAEGASELNYRLYGGEQIRIPEAARVFVVGNVRRPGAFPLKDPADATVLKILAQAEGLTPYSQAEAIIYRRDRRSGQRTEINVPLKKILDRKAPDSQLEADDLLYVPEAKGRRLTANALDRLIGFGSSTASVLVWRF